MQAKNLKKYLIIFSLFFTLVTNAQATANPTPCAPGYLQGSVPTTQVPDYSYTSDGFLELHFRLDTTRWKYNYARYLDYDKDCNLLIGGIGQWGDKQSFAWPSVNHLVLRYAEDNPDLPGLYHYNAYNGDTGAPIALDINEPLGNFSRTYFNPTNRPIHRFIFGNRDATNFDWNTETGDIFSTPALPMKITPSKTPVLIIPGVLGTDINKGNEKLWLDLGRNFTDIGDDFMDPLQFKTDLTPTDTNLIVGDVIRKPSILFDYAQGLIEEFQNQGYIEDTNLFTFPYDWRYGASGVFSNGQTNIDLLQQKIADIVAQTGSSKVDTVAHSTGGLLVKKYAVDHTSDHHIGKAVFVGVPNTGAPNAIKVLLSGSNFGIPWLSDNEMQKISKNLPVVYDLSPSQQYFNTKGSYVKVIDQDLFTSSSHDLDFDQVNDFLLTDHNLNSLALNNALTLHTNSFDNFDLRTTGVDLYSISGCKAATLGKLIERRSQTVFGGTLTTYDHPELVPGDGTVPLESATNLPIDLSNKYYSLKTNHSKMPSQDGIRQKIVNLIAGSQTAIDSGLITQDISQCKLKGKAISIYSPVDIVVTDALGNSAGLSEDGESIENNIPNADFQIVGEHKFVYLPEDQGQAYTINLKGSGAGTFTLKNANIDNNQTTQTEIFADLPVTTNLSGQVNLGSISTTLSLDNNSDGVIDEIINPSSVIYPDTIPPETIIQFDPIIKDLQFIGTDDISTSDKVKVVDTGGRVVLTDEANNTLDIVFVQTNRRSALKADIKTLTYNGQIFSINPNSLSFSWRLDSQGVLKSLTQVVKSRAGFSIKAVYDGSKTILTGTDQSGKISKTLDGLVLLKISTNNGDLSWTY